MPNWGAIAKAAAPAVIGAVGAIAGGKAKAGANQASQAAIQKAYQDALAAYNTSHGQATDINNWMLQSSFAPLNYGYQQGRVDLQNALLGGQQGLAAGQAGVADILGPYTGAGRKASGETNFLLYGGGQGSTPPPTAGNFPAPSPGSFSLPPDFKGFNIAAPPGGGGFGGGAGAPGGGGEQANMLTDFNTKLGYSGVQPSKNAALAGGLSEAALGPIGAAVGPLWSKFTQKGRSKEAASNAINEHSDWFWKEVVPTAQKENWSPDQLKQVANSGWNDYTNWVNQSIPDTDVQKSSIASQKNYFNQGLASNPYTKSLGIQV
jgi:hypothetical protein